MMKNCASKEKCVHPEGPVLPRDEFYKEHSKDGRRARCIACYKEADKQYEKSNIEKIVVRREQYYIDNKDRILKQHSQYRENNKEKTKERGKKYRAKNAEKIKASNEGYRENNKEKRSAYNKQWERDNRGKSRAKVIKRRLKKMNAIPAWADLAAVKDVYTDCASINILARIAGCAEKFVVDHIMPLQGRNISGLHVENNLQIITAKDNAIKSNKFVPINL